MEPEKVHSYRDLIVWQKSMELVVALYSLTEEFPQREIYGITSQMWRAAVSIPSNIAEGWRRGTKKGYRHFLLIAYGSESELETQLDICKRLPLGQKVNFSFVESLLNEVMRMLNVMIHKLSSPSTS